MKRAADFEAYFRELTATVLSPIERERSARMRRVLIAWAVLFTAGLLAIAITRAVGGLLVGIGGAAVLLGAVAFQSQYRPFRADFKRRCITPLINAVDPGLQYESHGTISQREFESAGLFRGLSITDFDGEDLVRGTLGETAIRFSELNARHVEQGRRQREETRIFKGVFFIADFNKHFRGSTYVLPDIAQRVFGGIGQTLQSLSGAYGELVKLEDPEFERAFVVYGSDQIESRYVLSSALMRRILTFRQLADRTLRMGFVGSKLYLAIDMPNRNLFEPRFFSSVQDRSLFRAFWQDLQLIIGLVEDLRLNTRIWSKE